MKSVNELCKQIKGIYNVDGNANTMITGISSDSRTIEKGTCLSASVVFIPMGLFTHPRLWKKALLPYSRPNIWIFPVAPSKSWYRMYIMP